MSRFSPGLTRAGPSRVLAAALVVVAAGGVTIAVTAATAAARPATPPPLDHQLCYTVKVPVAFKIPKGVVLANQFSPKGFRPAIKPAVVLCNPVVKTLPPPSGTSFPVKNPKAHLLCFPIKAPKQPTPTVVVANQFGKAKLLTGQPNLLCLPSWKSLTGPPKEKAVQPPGLDHFTCYPVKLAPHSPPYQPPPVLLKDEFTRRAAQVQVQPVPSELCVPTKKTIGHHVTKIVNPAGHLLCFTTTPTPTKPKAFVKNQFGSRTVKILHTLGLCVPSHKRIVSH